jgi:hypothetical protein
MCGNVGPPADLDRFPEGIEEAVPKPVAHVGVVDAAEPGRLLREGDQLVRVGVAPGGIVEAGRHPPGALLHRGPEQRALVLELNRPRGAIAPADGAHAEGGVPDKVDDVDGHAAREKIEVLLHGGPAARERWAPVEAGVDLDERLEILGRGEGRVRAAVDADDLGRDPLPHLGLVPGLGQNHEAGVGVHVDEPGADDAPRGVERAMRLHAVEGPAEQPEPLALDANRPEVPGVAGAVDDETARNQQVEHGRASGRQSITGARQAAARGGGDSAPSSVAGARSIRAGPLGRARC